MILQYSVKVTPHAILQIQDTIAYISKELLVPETARAWSDYLEKQISELGTMPERFPIIEDEPWKSRGYRKMPLKNFIVYYYVDEERRAVWVTAVVYGRRDQLNALKQMP